MRLLISWLRDFVDVASTPEALADTLSMRGFEPASIEEAPAGARPPGAEAAPSTPPGGRDAVIDFEITANRPDCLSVLGLAREVATSYGLPLREPGPEAPAYLRTRPLAQSDTDSIEVRLEDPELCPRYAAAVADVVVGTSPAWLAERLRLGGIRPINNVVDVTNYVLLEMGQPMHAFDIARLAGPELRIRRAKRGERIRTLDGEDRTLGEDMLVIADRDRPQAVAGVMGGGLSEVGPESRTVVFESATFDPRSVRLTSRRLGLGTEASYRFERGADAGIPVWALQRACALLEFVGAGRARGDVVDRYPTPVAPRRISLRRDRIARLLGAAVPDELVTGILEGLGFTAVLGGIGSSSGWHVDVPTGRVDVRREVDLIEEIARHYGYDRLPTTFPALVAAPPKSDPRIERDRLLRRVLTAAGFSEAITYAFTESGAAAPFAGPDPEAVVPIARPLSEKFAVLRPSLLPGLLESVAYNRRRERHDVRLFEIGSRFSTTDGERRALALVWTGEAIGGHWSGGGRAVDFFDLKGVIERVCDALGAAVTLESIRRPYLADGRAAGVMWAGQEIGVIGQLDPSVVEATDEVYGAELDLDQLTTPRDRDTRVTPLPRHPSIVRDISIIVADTLPAAAVHGTIRSAAPPTLVRVQEFDRYQGPGVPAGRVSLSLRLTFRLPDRTLTDAEVQDAMAAVLAALARDHGAVQR